MSEHDLREWSKPEVNELLELEKSATPGPWEAIHDADGDFAIFRKGWATLIAVTNADEKWDEANANLIVAMRNQFAAILEENQRLRNLSSRTYGELPETIRKLLQPHVWDNKNISEQRDWAIEALEAAEEENQRMKEEKAALKSADVLNNEETAQWMKRAEAAEAKLGEMREALKRYGEHDLECEISEEKCKCGFVAALAE